jgi:peptidoglycan/xylan/chitin deacetylase (PgdA/CDA1 family)
MKIHALFPGNRPRRHDSRPLGPAAVAILVALVVAACSTGTYPTMPAVPSGTTPAARATAADTPLPTAIPTPEPTLPAFGKVVATSCDPALVPEATPVATVPVTAARAFRLMVPILTYHRILPASEAGDSLPGLVVSPAAFAAELSAFRAAGWRTIRLGTLADLLAAGTAPPPRTFVITIDDGWSDGYTYAAPILRDNGFVATFFVIAGRIGWSNILSPSQMRDLIAAGNEIGNHTMDHTALAYQTNARMIYEIASGSATIAAATGVWPATFSYPKGSWNMRAMAAVEACASIKMAVIEGDATWETWATRFATPRIHVGPDKTPSRLIRDMTNPDPPRARTEVTPPAIVAAAAPGAAETPGQPSAPTGPAGASPAS